MNRIVKALTAAAVTLNEPMCQDRILGYLAALEGLKPDDVVIAIAGQIKTNKFFPRPADIIKAVNEKKKVDSYDSRYPKFEQLEASEFDPSNEELAASKKAVDDICREFSKRMGWD